MMAALFMTSLVLVMAEMWYASPLFAQSAACSLQSAGVYVAVSSEAVFNGEIMQRWLQVRWWGLSDLLEGDFVGLWDHDPQESLTGELFVSTVTTENGSLTTSLQWDGSLIPLNVEGVAGDGCLPYWAGFVSQGVVTHAACFRFRPHWMQEIKSLLQDVKLVDVLLPGTHDAGASGYFARPLLGDVVDDWTFTQDESLWGQLVLGSRYVDMRISYYTDQVEKFFVTHGEVRIAPLVPYLQDVASFMNQTEEILVFDIHSLDRGFDGFPERHEELITLLEEYFLPWMAPENLGSNPTLKELWGTGRLIVTYPISFGVGSPNLWVPVDHIWGNKNDVEDLHVYLDTAIPQQEGKQAMWSAMGELTPSVFDVMLNSWGGLRGAAVLTNAPVSEWLRRDWWATTNIIAMDFLPASDVVAVAVQGNIIKQTCPGARRVNVNPGA